MAKEGSFIKLDRKILQWGWYTNVGTKTLFLHCLLMANWKPGGVPGGALRKRAADHLPGIPFAADGADGTAGAHGAETSGNDRGSDKARHIEIHAPDGEPVRLLPGRRVIFRQTETKERQGTGKQTTTIKERKEEKETKEGPAYPDGEDVPSGDAYMEDYYKHRGA